MQKHDVRPSPSAGEAKLHFLDYWRVIRVRLGIVVLTFLLVLVTAAVTTYFLPRKYRSTAKVELRMEGADFRVFKDTSGNQGMDPRFLPTQIEIFQSTAVLYPVVESLQLTQRPGWASEQGPISREAAYYKLRNMLTLKPARNTEVLDLTVANTDPNEAAELANAIVQSYQDRRLTNQRDLSTSSLGELEKDLETQRKKVSGLEKQLLEMSRQSPEFIRDYTLNNNIPSEDPRKAQLDVKQAEVDKLTTSVAALTTQLDKIKQLKGDELIRALATLEISDPTVQKVLPQYQESLAAQASMLQSGLGSSHPKVASLRASINTFASQLSEASNDIKRSLSIRLDVAKKTLESVKDQLEQLRGEQRTAREGSTDYYQLKEEYNKAKAILISAEQRKAQESMDKSLPTLPVRYWQRAEVPSAPSSPIVWLNMVLGAVVGLIVGVGLAFFIEYLDTSVKTMNDVETLLGVPVLAIIPKDIHLLHKQPSDIPDAEAYRILRTNIEFNRKSADANTISMVSGGPGEGKSTTLCNLAYTCAQGGYSVLIVDADLRRPTQHKLFEISNAIGLTNYLTTNVPLEEVILPTGIDNLYLMPSGILPADAVGILNSQRMSDMIAELKTRFDIIFFDSPPILGVSDGAVLASEVDQSILIVQHRRFPRAMLQRVKGAVTNVGGTVLGVVLNNVDLRHDPNYAYYTSYYEYYSPKPSSHEARSVIPAAAGTVTPIASSGKVGSKNGNGASDY